MKRVSLQILLFASISILCGAFSPFNIGNTSAPVTRTGLSNIAVKQIDSCLLIYAINTANNSFVVDMYDPQLRLVHQFTEKISGFIPYTATLQYSSDLRLEFVITDHYNSKQQYIFLNKELVPYYRSSSSPQLTLLTSSLSKTLDEYRIDDFAWEIRTELVEVGWSGRYTVTSLYQYGIKLSPQFPMMEVNRRIVLDSAEVEYAKVFLVRDNKIYVYVNQSTESGKQFVYCISGLDGSLIYKTQLRVQYGDSSPKPYADACIYSNCFWNDKLNKLMISGTWVTASSQQSGLFLIMLNDDGTVNASSADNRIYLLATVPYSPATGMAGYSVASNSYQCVRKMQYANDGQFVVLSETYGRKLKPKEADAQDLVYVDGAYHYFCVAAQYYDIANGSIRPVNHSEFFEPVTWSANHHLDSITGFVPKETKIYDEQFANDINRICDGTIAESHYESVFFTGKPSHVKLLSSGDVTVSPGKNTVAYFSKIAAGGKKQNCIAFLSPNPIHEQNFSERNDFYAIDAQRLYRVHLEGTSYTLSVIPW